MSQEMTGYPSIDKPWLKYYSREAIEAPITEPYVRKSWLTSAYQANL